jgi:hypothetical protein
MFNFQFFLNLAIKYFEAHPAEVEALVNQLISYLIAEAQKSLAPKV